MSLGLYPELQPGSEILAQSFSDTAPALTIRVASSDVARGGTAIILKGDVVSPWPAVVALKVVMDVAREDSNHYHERTRREIAAIQRVQHRFILPFLGIVVGGAYTVLVSLFMENGDLLEYFRAKPDANRRSLIIQVADAVNYLHSQAGLVHGDLKCQNVLVSPNGDAQLADFGLSTIVDKSLSTDTTTIGIRQSYTLQFAAPELLNDEAKSTSGKTRSKTPQTDVFAFGRLILQGFTGAVPWPDLPLHAVFHKVLNNTIPERKEGIAALGLNDVWWSVCLACWRTKPKERPTMAAVMLDLSEAKRSTGNISRTRPLETSSLPSFLPSFLPSPQSYKPPPHPYAAATFWLDPQPPGKPSAMPINATSVTLPTRRHGLTCNSCRKPIVGIRYQCATCSSSPDSYNLCVACEMKSYVVHDNTHIFFKFPRPVMQPLASPFPFLPPLYCEPAGLLPDGTWDDKDPEGYLVSVRNTMVRCDWCMERIEGKWYHCACCGKNLCDACEATDAHDESHVFIVFKAQVDMSRLRKFRDLDNPVSLLLYPVY